MLLRFDRNCFCLHRSSLACFYRSCFLFISKLRFFSCYSRVSRLNRSLLASIEAVCASIETRLPASIEVAFFVYRSCVVFPAVEGVLASISCFAPIETAFAPIGARLPAPMEAVFFCYRCCVSFPAI